MNKLNILLKLHQTTTSSCYGYYCLSWISFWNYIKPQLQILFSSYLPSWISFWNYIKPQHLMLWYTFRASWISFWNYIKPQQPGCKSIFYYVEYPFEITSNHNQRCIRRRSGWVEYPFEITSNHNFLMLNYFILIVEYPFEITSNHNECNGLCGVNELNILLKLHQTTTFV